MLWHKAWVDTRWRFLLALALLLVLACGTLFDVSEVRDFLGSIELAGRRGRGGRGGVRESLELIRTFRGYAWSQWFAQSFPVLLTLMAALLGSGSPLVKGGSGALFSLALPVSRGRWIARVRGTALAELFVLALAPSLAFAALAPVVGEQFAVIEAVAYGLSAFVGASLFSPRRVPVEAVQRRLAAVVVHVRWRARDRLDRAGTTRPVSGDGRPKLLPRARSWPSCSSALPSPRASFTPPLRTSRGGTSDQPLIPMRSFVMGVSNRAFVVRSGAIARRLGERRAGRDGDGGHWEGAIHAAADDFAVAVDLTTGDAW